MRLLLLAFGFLALAWSGFQPSPAAAHAQLQATIPAAGSVLPQAPQEVRLTFSEPVAPLVLRWIAPDGSELALPDAPRARSEEHTSELQSLMRISYAVFCLKKKNTNM